MSIRYRSLASFAVSPTDVAQLDSDVLFEIYRVVSNHDPDVFCVIGYKILLQFLAQPEKILFFLGVSSLITLLRCLMTVFPMSEPNIQGKMPSCCSSCNHTTRKSGEFVPKKILMCSFCPNLATSMLVRSTQQKYLFWA